MSATPGRTKHFQVLLTNNINLFIISFSLVEESFIMTWLQPHALLENYASLNSGQQSRLERGGLDVCNFGTLILASKLMLHFESLRRAAVQWEMFSIS